MTWNEGLDLTQLRNWWRRLSRASGHEENLDVKLGRARQTRTHEHNWNPASNFNNEAGALCHGDSQAPSPGLGGAEGVAGLAADPYQQDEPAEKCHCVWAEAVTNTLPDLQSIRACCFTCILQNSHKCMLWPANPNWNHTQKGTLRCTVPALLRWHSRKPLHWGFLFYGRWSCLPGKTCFENSLVIVYVRISGKVKNSELS